MTISFLIETAVIAVCYYSGLWIRYKTMPAPDAPSLGNQCLLGLLLLWLIIVVMSAPLALAIDNKDNIAVVAVCGLSLEHGFFFNENFTRWLGVVWPQLLNAAPKREPAVAGQPKKRRANN